jgi:hypothetical protein
MFLSNERSLDVPCDIGHSRFLARAPQYLSTFLRKSEIWPFRSPNYIFDRLPSQHLNGSIMAILKSPRPRLGLPNPRALKIADVEYRIVWNEDAHGWDALRNGVVTNVCARKKKKSAVDSAIRDAKAELMTSSATFIVTCLEGRKLETLWKGP